MNSLISIVLLVFPGYFAASLVSFFWGRRGGSSSEKVLEASIYSVTAFAVYALVLGQQPFATLGDKPTVGDIVSTSSIKTTLWLTLIATISAAIITALTRAQWARQLLQKLSDRTLSYDVLYEKYLAAVRAQRDTAPESVRSVRPIAIVHMKSGRFLKGTISALPDTDRDRCVFLENVDWYDDGLVECDSLDVFLRDDARSTYIDGAGVYIPLREVDMVWLGVDENRFLKFRSQCLKRLNATSSTSPETSDTGDASPASAQMEERLTDNAGSKSHR